MVVGCAWLIGFALMTCCYIWRMCDMRFNHVLIIYKIEQYTSDVVC